MSYFRIDTTLRVNEEASLEGGAVRHMRDARRVKIGEEIEVQDPTPKRYLARVITVSREGVSILPLREIPLPEKPKAHLTLVQALISEQNLDLILQKATELGVDRVILFQAENSPHPLKGERLAHKKERWQRIMSAACEQSGRPNEPLVELTDSFEAALLHTRGTLYLLDEHGDGGAHAPLASDATIIVGPEGGLTEAEKLLSTTHGALSISIGPYTLRAETAAIAGVARVLS